MTQDRIAAIRNRLEGAFTIERLEIKDESHLHVGHAGAASGMGHFYVVIAASEFDQLPSIKSHRLIYQALGDLMHTDIHALRISASGRNPH